MDAHAKDEAASRGEGQGGEAGGGERIAKVLARAGVASRREVERLIAAGRVAVNGETLQTQGLKVSAADRVTLDGRPIAAAEPTRLFRYHKPTGLVTTHSDPKGRPTVFGALPKGLPRVISVGRLDLNSEGLLLLTNDGALARSMELPSSGLTRRYRARARGRVDQAALDGLKEGITVAGVHYGPIQATLEPGRDGASNQWIGISLAEGKNREVRKVLEALGLTVNRLIRTSYGPYDLGDLQPGEVREIVLPSQPAARAGFRAKPSPQQAGNGGRPVEPVALAPGDLSILEKPKHKPGWAKAKPRRPLGPGRKKR